MDINDYMIPCMSKTLFGVECFGCGTQRSLALILKGEFIEAFYMFPAIYTSIILFISIALHFIDKSRNYHKAIVSFTVLNALIMVIAYFYKHINL